MAAAFGASFGASAIASIFDDLAAAFKTVFNNIYRFVKPGWVITFAAGAPIALKYIDDGIDIAEKIIGDWTDALWTTASNVYNDVYKWVCNQLGGCGGFKVFETAAATMAAAIASGPIWLAAVIMKYIIQPMVKRILGILKQIFLAIYKFVCNVLVPIVRVAIAAYVDYIAVKGVYRHMGDTIASWFSSWSPKEIFKAIGKTVGVFAAPLASGFLAMHLYEHILRLTGACSVDVELGPIAPPGVLPSQQATSIYKNISIFEELYGSILPEGVSSTLLTYTVPVAESLSGSVISIGRRTYEVNISETLSASILKSEVLPYKVTVTEELSALIVGRKPLPYEVTVTEELSASILGPEKARTELTYEVNITESLSGSVFVLVKDRGQFLVTSSERYSYEPSPKLSVRSRERYSYEPAPHLVVSSRERYSYEPAPHLVVSSRERYSYGPAPHLVVETEEEYEYEGGQKLVVTMRESYSIES